MARKIEVEIVGDASSFQRALGKAQTSGSKFGSFAKLGIGAAITGIGAAAVGMGVLLKRGFSEFNEAQKVTAQTNAVLKSTGRVANVTKRGIANMSEALSELSGVDDEVIQSGQNMLLTFTNVRNELGKGNQIFDQATRSALDMSVALGTDLRNANLLVGKALNDPVRGLTALRRVGVSFTEQQEKQIKKLVESGKTMEAQKVILKELGKEFGGSAAAAGGTLAGQLNKLRNRFDEMAGSIAKKLVPVLLKFVDWINEHWPQIEKVVGTVFQGWLKWMDLVIGFFRTHWPTVVEFIRQVVDGARDQFDRLVEYWNGTLKPAVENIIAFAKALWARFGDDLQRNLRAAIEIVQNLLGVLKGIFELVMAVIRGDWSAAWQAIKDIARNALGALSKFLENAITNLGKIAKRIGVGLKDGIVAGLRGLAGLVGAAVRAAINAAIDAFNALADFTIDPPGPGSIRVNFPNIPRIASGGTITQSGLAVVHRGETVVPARVNRSTFASTGGGEVRVIVVGGDQQAIRWLDQALQSYRRGQGGALPAGFRG